MTRHAFTLLEVLAATALATLLMLVILTVTTDTRRARTLMQHMDATNADHQLFHTLLQDDLIHADTISFKENRLELTGYNGLDRNALEPAHRHTRVTYTITDIGGDQRVLVREQVDLDSLSNREAYLEIVLRDVAELLYDDGNDDALEDAAAAIVAGPQDDTESDGNYVQVSINWEMADRVPLISRVLLR